MQPTTETRILLVAFCILLATSSHLLAVQAIMVTSHAVVSELGRDNLPIGLKTNFKRGDPKAISWVKLISLNGTYKCVWKWIDPNKNMQTETSKEISGYKASEITFSELILDDAIFGKPGAWSVQFYINDEYQFTDVFNILSDKVPETPKPTNQTPVTKGANLTIVELTQSPAQGEAIYPGDNVTLTFTVENSGDTAAKNVTVTAEAVPSGLDLLKQAASKDISKAERASFFLVFKASAAGNYELNFRATAEGKDFDTKKAAVTVAQPDIFIVSVGVETSPEKGTAVKPGDYVTYTVSLKNTGTTPARTVEVKLGNIPEGIKLVQSAPIVEIGPGETNDFTFKFLCEKAGDYKIKVDLIVMGKTMESDSHLEVAVSEPITIGLPVIGIAVVLVAAVGLGVFYKKKGLPQISLPKVSREPRPRPSEEAAVVRERKVEVAARYCGSCGAPVDASTEFCGKCGKPV